MNGSLARRGSALISVLILGGTLTMFALIFLRVGAQVSVEQNAAAEDMHAEYLAEAALSEAVEALRSGSSGNVGTRDDPAFLGGGFFWVEATDLGGGRTQLDAMAMKRSGREAVRAVVAQGAGGGGGGGGSGTSEGFFTMLFSNEHLQLDQDVMIDSYDSALGTYASQATNTKDGFTYAGTSGGASGNATVQLDTNVHVFGDVYSGPDDVVTLDGTAHVSGTTGRNPERVELAPIPVPVIPAIGPYAVGNFEEKTIPSGTYHFTGMKMGKGSKLNVVGPATIVLDGFVAGKHATLEIDSENGPVTIYDTGIWEVDTGFYVGPPPGGKVDAAFLISSVDQTVQFDKESEIRIGFYVPDSRIQVDQGAEVWGALVANEIDIDAGTHFHFDENLRGFKLPWEVPEGTMGEPTEDLEVLSWFRIEFPDDELRADRRDPVVVLGLNRGALRSPAAAWEGGAPSKPAGGGSPYPSVEELLDPPVELQPPEYPLPKIPSFP